MIEVIECHNEGKISADLCEDSYFFSDDFVCIFDGVTSKSKFQWEGKKSGKIAAELAREAMLQVPAQADIQEIIAIINHKFLDFYKKVEFPYDIRIYGIQAAAAIYSAYHHTIWLIGDCQCLAGGQYEMIAKLSDQVLSSFRHLVYETNRANEDYSQVENLQMARELIQPWLAKTTIFANDPTSSLGYSVLSGVEIPDSLIKEIALDSDVKEIVIASDGYPMIYDNLSETEAYLAKVNREDPLCLYMNPSTKGLLAEHNSYDDRTYIRFKVN